MASELGHVRGVALDAQLANFENAGPPVGVENETENLGEEVVKFGALAGVGELLTIRAALIGVFRAARPDFAPGGSGVFVAARAAPLEVSAARPAVKAAVSNQLAVRRDLFHLLLLGTRFLASLGMTRGALGMIREALGMTR